VTPEARLDLEPLAASNHSDRKPCTDAPLSIHAGLEIQVFAAKFLMNSNSTGHRIARWSKSEQRKCLNIGAPKVMNLGTGAPQFPYLLEQMMMPIGRAVGAAFASAIFVSCVAANTAQ
jgi:hypothetical protein